MTRLLATPSGYEVDLEDMPGEARAVIEEMRGFETAAYRVLLTNELTDAQRPAAMVALMIRARSTLAPDLYCRAVERAEHEWAEGRPPDAWYARASIEEAVVRDSKKGKMP